MDEKAEDMLIALYLTGEGKLGFDNAHFERLVKIMKIIEEVRKELKKKEPEGPDDCGSLRG